MCFRLPAGYGLRATGLWFVMLDLDSLQFVAFVLWFLCSGQFAPGCSRKQESFLVMILKFHSWNGWAPSVWKKRKILRTWRMFRSVLAMQPPLTIEAKQWKAKVCKLLCQLSQRNNGRSTRSARRPCQMRSTCSSERFATLRRVNFLTIWRWVFLQTRAWIVVSSVAKRWQHGFTIHSDTPLLTWPGLLHTTWWLIMCCSWHLDNTYYLILSFFIRLIHCFIVGCFYGVFSGSLKLLVLAATRRSSIIEEFSVQTISLIPTAAHRRQNTNLKTKDLPIMIRFKIHDHHHQSSIIIIRSWWSFFFVVWMWPNAPNARVTPVTSHREKTRARRTLRFTETTPRQLYPCSGSCECSNLVVWTLHFASIELSGVCMDLHCAFCINCINLSWMPRFDTPRFGTWMHVTARNSYRKKVPVLVLRCLTVFL